MDVPLDAIARRAGVGIGTLYRRFPDREAVIQAVALGAFATVTRIAEDFHDRDGALRSFLLEVAQQRLGVLMPSFLPVLTELPRSTELTEVFQRMLASVDKLIAGAHADGELRSDVTADDVLLLLGLLTRPLEGLPLAYSAAVAPRLLHLLLESITPSSAASEPPPNPAPLDVDGGLGLPRRDGYVQAPSRSARAAGPTDRRPAGRTQETRG